jgi:hypothetical protein
MGSRLAIVEGLDVSDSLENIHPRYGAPSEELLVIRQTA